MSKQKSSFGQSDIVRLSDEDAATELLERAVTGLWEVVNELTRFRRTTRQNYRVTIFGSARLKPGTPAYDGVKQLAAELTKMGCDIISGGGPGLMQAANEGAHSIGPKALQTLRGHPRGVAVRAGDQPVRRSGLRTSHLFFATTPFYDHLRRVRGRSRWYRNSVGVVARMATPPSPQALQHASHSGGKNVGRTRRMGSPLDAPKGNELASEIDFTIPHCVNTIEEAVAIIRENRAAWLAAQKEK